jgi:hypothetical protein
MLPLRLLLLAVTLTTARTLPLTSSDKAFLTQQILLDPAHPYRPVAHSKTSANFLDAQPNTVGVLFMKSEDEGLHVWLPIGRRVFVRKSCSH